MRHKEYCHRRHHLKRRNDEKQHHHHDNQDDDCDCDDYPLKNAPSPLEQPTNSRQSSFGAEISGITRDHSQAAFASQCTSQQHYQTYQHTAHECFSRQQVTSQLAISKTSMPNCTLDYTISSAESNKMFQEKSNRHKEPEDTNQLSTCTSDEQDSLCKIFTDLDAAKSVAVSYKVEPNLRSDSVNTRTRGTCSSLPTESRLYKQVKLEKHDTPAPNEGSNSDENNSRVKSKKLKLECRSKTRRRKVKNALQTRLSSEADTDRLTELDLTNNLLANTPDMSGFCSADEDELCQSECELDSEHLLFNNGAQSDKRARLESDRNFVQHVGDESDEEATMQSRLPYNQPMFHSSDQHSCRSAKLTEEQVKQLGNLISIIKEGKYNEFIELLEEKELKQKLLNVFVNGQTPLHYALLYGRSLAWCKQLVLGGANPNLTNRAGWHPIHLAAYSCSHDTMGYLLDCLEMVPNES